MAPSPPRGKKRNMEKGRVQEGQKNLAKKSLIYFSTNSSAQGQNNTNFVLEKINNWLYLAFMLRENR
jgi:hypothetical protein